MANQRHPTKKLVGAYVDRYVAKRFQLLAKSKGLNQSDLLCSYVTKVSSHIHLNSEQEAKIRQAIAKARAKTHGPKPFETRVKAQRKKLKA